MEEVAGRVPSKGTRSEPTIGYCTMMIITGVIPALTLAFSIYYLDLLHGVLRISLSFSPARTAKTHIQMLGYPPVSAQSNSLSNSASASSSTSPLGTTTIAVPSSISSPLQFLRRSLSI